MSPARDPRRTPARPDLAADFLKGQVTAGRFVPGIRRRVVEPVAPLKRRPEPDASLDSEVLLGEIVTVYEETPEGWAWGQLETDGYVGWIPADALGPEGKPATHVVTALATFLYPGPEMKLPPRTLLSAGSRLTVTGTAEKRGLVYALTSGGAVVLRHLAPLGVVEPDFVAVAERYVGRPYLWGGRSSIGIDCSGLVQAALLATGIPAPRDSDMQAAELGTRLPAGTPPERGDLAFWPGHVGILLDGGRLLHASGTHMSVVVEPFAEAVARIAAGGTALTGINRL